MLKTQNKKTHKLFVLGNVPSHITKKAEYIINNSDISNLEWCKLSGLKDAYSLKLSKCYRILLYKEKLYIGHHDEYSRKIKSLKNKD